ncbi:MAG TPA: twin-arginine translocase subunit TatC [Desulfurivibrionaceae bacterium]|nr:twin-arginine translocase subunit TatC [Desulfurivibrionaceae bacterium]
MPLDTPHQLAAIINGLRRSALRLLGLLLATTAGCFLLAPQLLQQLQLHLKQGLAFFTVAEPFLAHIKLALAAAVFLLVPGIAAWLWRALAKPFGFPAATVFWFVLFTCVLFYSGAGFCYFLTLPFGVDFLLEFQSAQLKPVISIDHFVTFVTLFVLAFGLIFELPIFMVFLAKAGLCRRQTLERNRRYAILVISIIAALLTPTPDIFNMMLMGLPLYLLYEAGIITIRLLKIT